MFAVAACGQHSKIGIVRSTTCILILTDEESAAAGLGVFLPLGKVTVLRAPVDACGQAGCDARQGSVGYARSGLGLTLYFLVAIGKGRAGIDIVVVMTFDVFAINNRTVFQCQFCGRTLVIGNRVPIVLNDREAVCDCCGATL